jgi:hypothetical protein
VLWDHPLRIGGIERVKGCKNKIDGGPAHEMPHAYDRSPEATVGPHD